MFVYDYVLYIFVSFRLHESYAQQKKKPFLISEQIHDFCMGCLIQNLFLPEFILHIPYCITVHAIGIQKLLKIKWIHLYFPDTANRYGSCLRKCYPKQRATGNKCISVILRKKFKHGKKMRVSLYFINENQCVLLLFYLFTLKHTQLKIEIFRCSDILKQLWAFIIFNHIHFDEIFK